MGLMDKIRAALGRTRDPQEELARAQKQAEVEALKREEMMKVKLPPGSGSR